MMMTEEGSDHLEAQEELTESNTGGGESRTAMEVLLAEASHGPKSLHRGDVLDGVVMKVDKDEVLVDIGAKSEGVVPSRELQSLGPDASEKMSVGDEVLVYVVQPENQEGHAVLSIDRARTEKSWRRLQKQYEDNELLEAEVVSYNKGGLLVNLDGVRGFVPISQVVGMPSDIGEAERQAEMAKMIGRNLRLKVIEVNRKRNRLILSERVAAQEFREQQRERLIADLEEGTVRDGVVTSICDFGAFVDVGGADGLVHLSELSWSRVNHPSEVVKVGEKVRVQVLSINQEGKKIALSLKRTKPEPWADVEHRYEVGQTVTGVVTQLANFGAFVRVEDGIEGLIHISELSDERITHPKQVVKEGDVLHLKVVRVDAARHRMGLSLKQAQEEMGFMVPAPAEMAEAEGSGEESAVETIPVEPAVDEVVAAGAVTEEVEEAEQAEEPAEEARPVEPVIEEQRETAGGEAVVDVGEEVVPVESTADEQASASVAEEAAEVKGDEEGVGVGGPEAEDADRQARAETTENAAVASQQEPAVGDPVEDNDRAAATDPSQDGVD